MKRLLIVLLAMNFACSSEKESNQEPTDPVKETEVLSVMAYNIHIANPPSMPEDFVDMEAIANVIREAEPDLVALQEVDRFTDRSGKDLDQAKTLAEMTGMNYYFAKALNRSNGDYGVAILSKFPIKSTSQVSLPGAEGTTAELRTIGLIEVELENKKKIYFGSTHLDHLTDQSRLEQAKIMLNFLKDYQEHPIVLGGDFNMTPDNSVWNTIENDFIKGCIGTCPGTFPATGATTTIDYILLNKKAADYFTVKSYKTIDEDYASDHLPILMELEYEL